MSIASEITRLQTAKADIKTAIEAKGVTVPANATLDTYNTYVANIPTGGTNKLPEIMNKTVTTITESDLTGVTTIGKSFFENCASLTSVTLSSTVTKIDESAFARCAFTSIDLRNVTVVGWYSFRWNTALTSITFQEGFKETQWSCFEGCTGLTTITFPNGFEIFGHSTFYNCTGITSISLPSTVKTIDTEACYGCTSLTTINIPTNSALVKLGNKSFYNCTSLATITIPDNITNIDAQAFYGCTSLATINYTGTMAQWGSVTLGTNWNANVPATVVHCSDGDVTL